jgi:hypothetical protein
MGETGSDQGSLLKSHSAHKKHIENDSDFRLNLSRVTDKDYARMPVTLPLPRLILLLSLDNRLGLNWGACFSGNLHSSCLRMPGRPSSQNEIDEPGSGGAIADRNDSFDAWHFNQSTSVQILRRHNGSYARTPHAPSGQRLAAARPPTDHRDPLHPCHFTGGRCDAGQNCRRALKGRAMPCADRPRRMRVRLCYEDSDD